MLCLSLICKTSTRRRSRLTRAVEQRRKTKRLKKNVTEMPRIAALCCNRRKTCRADVSFANGRNAKSEQCRCLWAARKATGCTQPAQLSLNKYRVSQEEWTKLRESVPYVELYRYNPKHLYPKLSGYGDNGHRSLKL